MVDYLSGVLELSVTFLSVICGVLASTLVSRSIKYKKYKAWLYLIIVLILFSLLEIFSVLNSFNLFKTVGVTHILTSFILLFLIISLIKQIEIVRYKK